MYKACVRFLVFTLILSLCTCSVVATNAEVGNAAFDVPIPWNGHILRVSYAVDNETVKSGHAASGKKSIQVILTSTKDTLSWDEVTSCGADFSLRGNDGTEYGVVTCGFQAEEGSSRNSADLAKNRYVGFSPIFDVPKDIGFDALTLIVKNDATIEGTNVSLAGVPSEAPVDASSGNAPDPLEKYRMLLSNSKIASAMCWCEKINGELTYMNYNQWPDERRVQLFDALSRLENDEPFPMQSPPQLVEVKDEERTFMVMSDEDAWTIYVTHVAHSLWMEANHLVNWSLLDYNEDELAMLLGVDFLMNCTNFGYYFFSVIMGDVTDWNVEISYKFMKENQYIMDNPTSTVYAFADWIRYNVVHISGVVDEKNYKKTYGYSGPPPADKVLYPIKVAKGGYSYSAGCWGTTGLFAAVMRSVNIPVHNNPDALPVIIGGVTKGTHSRLELPTLGIGLCHSDDLYDRLCSPKTGGTYVPTEKLFHTLEWLDKNVDNPTVLDESDKYKNSVEDQGRYNYIKYTWGIAIEYLTDELLVQRADDFSQKKKPKKLQKSLTGDFAKPYYSKEEISQIVKKVDEELIRIGNGSWKKGASIVRKRVYKWV